LTIIIPFLIEFIARIRIGTENSSLACAAEKYLILKRRHSFLSAELNAKKDKVASMLEPRFLDFGTSWR
jgi:hypothetical protein